MRTSAVRPPPPSAPRWGWTVAAIVGVGALVSAAAFVVAFGRYNTEPAVATSPTSIAVLGDAVVQGELLGPVGGLEADAEGTFAGPDRTVSAPAPAAGQAVGWQWEQCVLPTSETCTAIGDATGASWVTPTVADPVFVRVTAVIDLGGGAFLRAASPTFTVRSAGSTVTAPGSILVPATSITSPATISPATAVAAVTSPPGPPAVTNPYGDIVGQEAAVDGADLADESPAARYARAVHALPSAWPTASNSATLFLRWASTSTPGGGRPPIATRHGYSVIVADQPLEIGEFTTSGADISSFTVCTSARCASVGERVVPRPNCQAGVGTCGTIVSANGAVTAVARATVDLDTGLVVLYETVSDREIAAIDHDAVRFRDEWFVVMLPAAPPPGATQQLTITFVDRGRADLLTIVY